MNTTKHELVHGMAAGGAAIHANNQCSESCVQCTKMIIRTVN